jgi:hypothetical protein
VLMPVTRAFSGPLATPRPHERGHSLIELGITSCRCSSAAGRFRVGSRERKRLTRVIRRIEADFGCTGTPASWREIHDGGEVRLRPSCLTSTAVVGVDRVVSVTTPPSAN